MKKFSFVKKNLVAIGLGLLLMSCSNEFDTLEETQAPKSELLNTTNEVDGVLYQLKDVSINKELVFLGKSNSTLLSIDNNVYNVQINSNETAEKLLKANTVYLQTGDTTYLKTIVDVKQEGEIFVLNTKDAGLGDLFQGGSIEMSVDIEKANSTLKSNSTSLRSTGFDNGISLDILNNIKEYQNGGLSMSPNTTVKAYFNVKVGFANKYSKLPNEVVVTYELRSAFNPYFKFSQAVNKTYQTDFITLVPAQLLKSLKSVELTVDLPLGDLGTLPAKIKIDDIKFPATVKANLAKATTLQFNSSGSIKMGYAYYKNVAGKKSHLIYENSMILSNNSAFDLYGEVFTDASIVITPKINLVDQSLFDIQSSVVFGLSTETSGGISAKTSKYIFGSKGLFYGKGVVEVKSFGIALFNTELINQTKELWNIGSFDKTFTLSNLRIAKPSKTQCTLRSYNYEMTVDYSYPMIGKKMQDNVVITYDVYDDANKILAANQVVTVTPNKVSDKSFSFNLCVPFKIDALGFLTGFTKKTGYIKNFKMTDASGSVATGIVGSSEIMLGSPYNTSVWK